MKNTTRYRVIELLELLSGSVLPIIFWVSLIFGFDAPYIAMLTIIAALLHELGHIVAIGVFVKCDAKIRGHASGFRIRGNGTISYGREIAIILSGPLVNVALYLICIPLGHIFGNYVKMIGYINLATGVSNLLPIEGHDGYGAIRLFLNKHGWTSCIKALEIFSFSACIALTFSSLHLIDRLGEGYWIFGLFFCTMLSKLSFLGKYDIFGE